jgi:hypothetical protein
MHKVTNIWCEKRGHRCFFFVRGDWMSAYSQNSMESEWHHVECHYTMNGVIKFPPKRVNSDTILTPCYGVVPNGTPWNLDRELAVSDRRQTHPHTGSVHQARLNCTVSPDPECTQNLLLVLKSTKLPLHKTTERLALKHTCRVFCTGYRFISTETARV